MRIFGHAPRRLTYTRYVVLKGSWLTLQIPKGVVAWFERASPPFAPPAQDGCAISLPPPPPTIEPSVFFVAAAARREVLKYSTIRSEPNPEFLPLLLRRRRHCGLKNHPFPLSILGAYLAADDDDFCRGRQGGEGGGSENPNVKMPPRSRPQQPTPPLISPSPSSCTAAVSHAMHDAPPMLLVHIRGGGRGLGPISRRSWGGGEALSNLKEGGGD